MSSEIQIKSIGENQCASPILSHFHQFVNNKCKSFVKKQFLTKNKYRGTIIIEEFIHKRNCYEKDSNYNQPRIR